MEIKSLRNLALEILKTINPSFMKSIFSAKLNARVRPNDILVKTRKSATFGDKNLARLGPKIWNALPQNIKAENFYVKFKECIATWFGPKCKLTYAVSITVKTKSLSNQLKIFSYFNVNPLLRTALLLSLLLILLLLLL